MSEQTQELQILSDSPLEQITRAEIDSQIATAKRYPRNLSQVRDRVLTLATIDEETAKDCFYARPVGGGKVASGESVRMAEILNASYGNTKAAWRPISIDRVHGVVTCQGVCHDLETNTSTSLEKSRQVQKKRGADTFDEHMIELAVNACGAIAYRDAVFKTIPKAIIKSLLPQIKEAARGKGTLDQKVDRIVNRLIEIGEQNGVKKEVAEKRVLAAVECKRRNEIDIAKLDILIGMGTSIKDGEMRFADLFPTEQKPPNLPGQQPGKPGQDEEGGEQ